MTTDLWSNVFMMCGFLLAGYSIIANDAIQTLGTFISSNHKQPWWVLWIFASVILVSVLYISWSMNLGDVSYGRLSEKFPEPAKFTWVHIVPPIMLLFLTRFGIPVSTTFLILPIFAPAALMGMLVKSLSGYAVAFLCGIVVYWSVAEIFERKCSDDTAASRSVLWVPLQWLSTAFLWSQWLVQDLANIFVYMPSRQLTATDAVFSFTALVLLLGFVFFSKGGKIQEIVTSKSNTMDIRSATVIDFIYGAILLYFAKINQIPMSTTWAFLGLLAGREIALTLRLKIRTAEETVKMIRSDGMKAFFGLALSVFLALTLPKIELWVSKNITFVAKAASLRP